VTVFASVSIIFIVFTSYFYFTIILANRKAIVYNIVVYCGTISLWKVINLIKNIFFDLDGTMLPMDQEKFVKVYFNEICKRFCTELKLDSESLIKGIWKGTAAMVKNDRSAQNVEVFWNVFAKTCGRHVLNYIKDFDDFYNNEFYETKSVCKFNPVVPETINVLKKKGYKLVAATNPIFPSVATHTRLKWAGLNPSDFALVTTYDNSSSCKPNPLYYVEIMEKLNLQPEECMMVGNDVGEDMIPTQGLGMDNYLVTDCLINRDEADYSSFKQGSFKDFLTYARMMPDVK
jgi:FMN phosphatase YigB (HAD superfamily)